MRTIKLTPRALLLCAMTMLFAGCERIEEPDDEPRLRLEVSRAARQLYVYRGDEQIRTHPVSVGQPEWPTPTGEWEIFQIDWNPDWVPPDSEWAEDMEPQAPGAPGNPMGRARLIFNPPYTIHGTDDLESLGRAESHGSIRVANDVVTELARLLMEEGGDPRDDRWYQEVLDSPTEMRQVELPRPIPIQVRD